LIERVQVQSSKGRQWYAGGLFFGIQTKPEKRVQDREKNRRSGNKPTNQRLDEAAIAVFQLSVEINRCCGSVTIAIRI
jgi:hypothetical protein